VYNNVEDENNLLDITLEEMIQTFETSMQKTSAGTITVEFLGGEPFLFINRLENICEYIVTNYPNHKFRFITSTNGTIYSDRVIDIIEKYNILLCISIDGNKVSHNSNRIMRTGKGSYDYIVDNINNFVKSGRNPIAHFTINRLNIGYLKEGITNLINLGFKRIEFGFVSADYNIIRDQYINLMTEYIISGYFNKHQIIVENMCNTNVKAYFTIQNKDGNGQLISEERFNSDKLTERQKVDIKLAELYHQYENQY
jgi:sulfatase maturation enzyme AslB (radical SAM superfamily)